ncbi:SRPBCC family protein [Sediminitomix flava]|uniref:Activator of Hsp90 ATPase-like protein n=1 Tax=Sediminitomix flava TaxID=379075 RepID=A0A315ZI95_SEDFL|nr:SRPBCC domain-containing protein [Sediminitomix flava]PWJ44538.1 activator of Hsp90 ATPase-like protein [Sediminitomix flava]
MKVIDQAIVVEQEFNCSKEKLWKTITDLTQMRQWFFPNIPAFEAKKGFQTQFTVQAETRSFIHLWEILEVITEQKIVYNWKYEEYQGSATVCFDLIEKENQSILRLTNTVLEDFDDRIPEFRRESCLEGWKYFIQQSLPSFLDQ